MPGAKKTETGVARKASASSCKTVLDKVKAAIRSKSGRSSRQAIKSYLENEFCYTNDTALKNALKKAVASGALTQSAQSFTITGELPCRDDAKNPEDELEIIDFPETKKAPKIKATASGEGEEEQTATNGDTLKISYKGMLKDFDGPMFDKASNFTFELGAGEVIKGWDLGIKGLKVGARRRLRIPSKLAYGKRGSGTDIPPNATLYFDVTLKGIIG